jgi:hypothetical protein
MAAGLLPFSGSQQHISVHLLLLKPLFYTAPYKAKTPLLPCATVPVNFYNMRDEPDCFRRPVKVSAITAACVPDSMILVQGQSSQSRTGQGLNPLPFSKERCHFK